MTTPATLDLALMLRIQNELIASLINCSDLQTGLDDVLRTLTQLDCLDCGGIYLIDPADRALVLKAHIGLSPAFVEKVSHYSADSPTVAMVNRGDIRYSLYDEFLIPGDDVRSREGLRAFAMIPVLRDKSAIAVLCMASRSEDAFPGETRTFLESVSMLMGNMLMKLRTDAALRESEEIFRQFMEHSPMYVFFKDENIRPLRLSRNYETMLGRPLAALLGKSMDDLFPSALAKKMVADDRRILEEGKVITVDEEFNGRFYTTIKFPIHIEGKPRYLSGYTLDITEKKILTEQMQRADKLDSLGILAGGIAHDFNNLLSGIFGYIELARMDSTEESVLNSLREVSNCMDRARALTGQLLTFAKGGAPIMKPGRLFPFVKETAIFALSGSNVSCSFEIDEALSPCLFDKNQIAQVIDNLIINAQQAMPLGGVIALTAENTTLAEGAHPSLAAGEYVKISIEDHGTGIAPDLLSRIFDPFFTTKTRGHGLGLSTCWSIISRHGGHIDVASTVGSGTVFHLWLPVSFEDIAALPRESDTAHRGSGTLILMDDEAVIRDIVGKTLSSFGYRILSAANGREAIDIFREERAAGRRVRGMIFDLTIPGGMGGKEAVREIRAIDTEVPVFVSSGYAVDPLMAHPQEHGFTASICKPFKRSELSDLLNKYLLS